MKNILILLAILFVSTEYIYAQPLKNTMLIDINNIEKSGNMSLYFDSIKKKETTLICHLKKGKFDPYYTRITLDKFNNKIENILFVYECDTSNIMLKNTYCIPLINTITIDTLSFKKGIHFLNLYSLYKECEFKSDVYISKFPFRKNDDD